MAWCNATVAFASGGEDDEVLYCGRKCIAGSAEGDGENLARAQANQRIASVLIRRGVFEDALTHARVAKKLRPDEPWTFKLEASALLGLGRAREAIIAAGEAVRLSDGSDATMHYTLGLANYRVQNWDFAMQSFKRAAELDPKDAAAASGAASSLEQMGYAREAARWFREVLRRDPAHEDRQHIVDKIRRLER